MDELIKRAADDLASARNVVALTGAGISVESGIPPFRGKGGLWEKVDPMEVASIDALMQNPTRVWKFVKEMNTPSININQLFEINTHQIIQHLLDFSGKL